MSRHDLKRLRYFVAVAEELHFGKAARRLHVSQPPLSQQIRLLEDEVGVSLFDRDTHRVRLTAAGEVYLTHAYGILRATERAVQDAQRASQGERGVLKLGYSASALYSDHVLRIIGRFRDECPNVKLILTEGRTHEQAERMERGDIDVAFVRGPLPMFTASWSPERRLLIAPEQLVVALPLDHDLCSSHQIDVGSLAPERFVAMSRSMQTALNRVIDGLLAARGISPDIVVETRDMSSVLGLVSVGVGIAIVPESLSRVYSGGVSFRPLADEDARIDLYRLSPENPSPAAMKLDALLAAMRSGAA